MTVFEQGTRVVVVGNNDPRIVGEIGSVDSFEFGLYFVILDGHPGKLFGFDPDEIVEIDEDVEDPDDEEDVLEAPPFGLSGDVFNEYFEALMNRVKSSVGPLGNEQRDQVGYMAIEQADLSSFLVATLEEIEVSLATMAALHLRVVRILTGMESAGLLDD